MAVVEPALTRETVQRKLGRAVESMTARQRITPGHPEDGAFINPETGIGFEGQTVGWLTQCGLLYCFEPGRADLLERMAAALDYLETRQRPSGRIDLHSANYDSAPDSGFALQLLCATIEIGRQECANDAAWQRVIHRVEDYTRRMAAGTATGGFHTPNHRWVIASALAQVRALLPDADHSDTIRAYLAEGFDIDAEGTYIERSVSVYDGVTDRSLMLLAANWPDDTTRQAALDAVAANLDFDLHLLHADGTAETGLSRRQDYGTRTVPTSLIAPALMVAVLHGDQQAAALAAFLWAQSAPDDFSDMAWIAYAVLKYGIPAADPQQVRNHDYTRFYPLNQVWRVRQSDLSATAFGSTTRLLTLVYGAASLEALKIGQSYFGVGRFVAETMTADGNTVTLHSSGVQRPRRPGYDLPTGAPVNRDDFYFMSRDYNAVPAAESTLTITRTDDGLELHYRTVQGLDGVTAQIALDFPAGGIWETADTASTTAPEQIIFLKQGWGRIRFGDDVIEISPGADAHQYWRMRDTDPVPAGCTRVLLAFLTPVDFRFTIRTR